MSAEQLIKEGRVDEALRALQDDVRNNPAKPESRAFLYQLLCVLGNWDRALTQINVLADLSPKELLMIEFYRNAIRCEALRAEVFAGRRTPLLLGEPAEWVGQMVQAQALVAQGRLDAAAALRDRAFESAPAVSGTINGHAFEWIADVDHRLGPIMEVIIQGKYYWTPMDNISSVLIEPPESLRDVVWARARFTWANKGRAVGLIPVRYPGTTEVGGKGLGDATHGGSGTADTRLARRTDFVDPQADFCLALGQRMWTTDLGDHPILETVSITLGPQDEEGEHG